MLPSRCATALFCPYAISVDAWHCGMIRGTGATFPASARILAVFTSSQLALIREPPGVPLHMPSPSSLTCPGRLILGTLAAPPPKNLWANAGETGRASNPNARSAATWFLLIGSASDSASRLKSSLALSSVPRPPPVGSRRVTVTSKYVAHGGGEGRELGI